MEETLGPAAVYWQFILFEYLDDEPIFPFNYENIVVNQVPPGYCSVKDEYGLTVYDWINWNEDLAAQIDLSSRQTEWLLARYKYMCDMYEVVYYDDIVNNPDNIALKDAMSDSV